MVPDVISMKTKFREFVNVDDADIQFAIDEAVVTCGSDLGEWVDEANHTLAMQYYAAHILLVSIQRAGLGSGGSSTGKVILSESTPELSRTYAAPPQASASEPIDLTMTHYGVRFLGLVQKNFPAVLTVGSAVRM
jgi:hypothetical protein